MGFARRSSNLRNLSVLQSRWIIQDYVSFETMANSISSSWKMPEDKFKDKWSNRILNSPVCAASQWLYTFISKFVSASESFFYVASAISETNPQ